jgi:hypothetical protein
MFERIVDWLIARAMKTPFVHLEGYMNRYWLLPYGWFFKRKGLFDWAARIHQILRSDDDRAFHDHPWNYVTVVLRGGYWEVRPQYDSWGLYTGNTRVWYGPGSILFRPAKSWHRLEIPEGKDAWTLFITGTWVQKWGFMPNPKWKIRYEEYLKENRQ